MHSLPKSSPETLARVRAWAAANPERRREIQRRHYLKSVGGALKPVLTPQQRFEQHYTPEALTGCWLWTAAVNKDGYGKVKVQGRDTTAHRWSWTLHNGPVPEGLHVLHRCDVPSCVNPAHLWLGTNLENDRDKRAKRRHYILPLQRDPKVTDGQVMEMRRLRGKETTVSLAARFGIHPSQVSRIQRGHYFKHLPMPQEK